MDIDHIEVELPGDQSNVDHFEIELPDQTIQIDVESPPPVVIQPSGTDQIIQLIVIDGIGPPGPPGTGSAWIIGETPSGAINGINQNYTTVSPFSSGTLIVYVNGLRMRLTADYTIFSNTSFHMIEALLTGDSLRVDYQV
jgi:hypothetical protein